MNIAIIGAGVSGLTTAYYLRKKFPDAVKYPITVYEKADKLGGNANTFKVNLPNGAGGFIERWVDMGVNDFNLGTYKELKELWQELGIMSKEGDCPQSTYCSPLINSESFSLPGADGSYNYRYTLEDRAKDNVEAPDGSAAKNDVATLYTDIESFKRELGYWYRDNEGKEGLNNMTVGEFLRSVNTRFSEQFINYNLYPRINGMYFTMEDSTTASTPPPSEMPLWMVAHYYILQEAYGQTIPLCKRQYFVNGSINWLDKLASRIGTFTFKSNCGTLAFRKQGSGKNDKIVIAQAGQPDVLYDKVIFATHADTTKAMLSDDTFKSDPMVSELAKFDYAQCNIYVHQDPTFLGPKKDIRRTYNIHVFDYNEKKRYPYSISYVVNMHQNDPNNPKYRGNPDFYLTINPYWTQPGVAPANMLQQLNGAGPAFTTMRHCKLNLNAVSGQVNIFNEQLGATAPLRSVYFTGSFTIGAGLHMECIKQARAIVEKIKDITYVPDHVYDFTGKRKNFAPQYVLDAITHTKD
ncbi:MAG: FAD-dependent oxidoreductase [Bacteroidota bacterium]